MRTIINLRLKKDRRGVSNIIVVVLSLIIITVIASNVVLWSYQMNQLDWEKIKENVKIADVARATHSSWFMTQSEYVINEGSRVSGTYEGTHVIGNSYESFREGLNWWNINYDYRRQTTIVNNVASSLDLGYSVCVMIDTASLVSAGKMLSSGDDLRVVYWDGSWIELDRDLVNMNTASTQVWFKTQAVIGPSPAADSNYYVYYGNPSATDPPAKKSNVYVWFDDFSTNTLANYDKAKWVDVHGALNEYILPTYDAANERVWFDTGDNYASDLYPIGVVEKDFVIEVDFWANGSYPSDATIALVGRLENPGTSSTHYYLDFSHGRYDSPGITLDSWVTGERSNIVYSEPGDYYWGFNTVHTFRYAIFGSTHKFWWNKDVSQPADVIASHNLHTAAGRLGLVPAQVRGWWDNFKVRKYCEPEPSASAGSEEQYVSGSYRLNINGTFVMDVSNYPLAYVQTVEIQLRYRADDANETWYLKAYDWTAMTYSDSGFNSTAGHMPTTGWDYYAVNLTDQWRSYVKDDGTMYIKFHDGEPDSNQTTIDIDFLGARALFDGTLIVFENDGAMTTQLVSMWVISSTIHQRYDVSVFINSGETFSYFRADIQLPDGQYMVKVITERGNVAVYSGG